MRVPTLGRATCWCCGEGARFRRGARDGGTQQEAAATHGSAQQREQHLAAGSTNPSDTFHTLISERVIVLGVVGESVSYPNGGEVPTEINKAMIKSGDTCITREESPMISESTLSAEKVDLAENAGEKPIAGVGKMAALEMKGNPRPVSPEISVCQPLQAGPAAADNKSLTKLKIPEGIQLPRVDMKVRETTPERKVATDTGSIDNNSRAPTRSRTDTPAVARALNTDKTAVPHPDLNPRHTQTPTRVSLVRGTLSGFGGGSQQVAT
jgi:hypothetical protein